MTPYRDELHAAYARIAELERELDELTAPHKASHIAANNIFFVVSAFIVGGFMGFVSWLVRQ